MEDGAPVRAGTVSGSLREGAGGAVMMMMMMLCGLFFFLPSAFGCLFLWVLLGYRSFAALRTRISAFDGE